MNTRKYRLSDIITVLGLLVIIYGFAIAMLLLPDKEYSEEENRYLQTVPQFSLEALTSGEFTADVASYCTDQMPLRNLFVGTKAVSETVLGKQENNSVLLGIDGHIIAKEDHPNYAAADKNLAAVTAFDEALGDIPLHLAVAGRSQDVLTSYSPALYPAKKISDTTFVRALESAGDISQIDLLTPLREYADAGEYVYYRTDHHWTTLGAYYAYREIMETYGMEPYPREYFTRETMSEEFYGTTWSKAGMKWIRPDTMEFFRFAGDGTLTCEIVGGDTLEGMYDLSYLEKKDKYSAFIGGNNARVRIYPSDRSPLAGERETLLLIKDSFGHSVAPFLAAHFDLEIIDLRYYKPLVGNPSMLELVKEVGADHVLILYNLDSLLNSDNLVSLTLGME
ncbi:MAG: hypothetical protein IJ428_04025 [Clostridia bacterium]|nr:hypothetical protein [Clostridia bacterium]